jgi:hypothetical protein
MQYVVLLELNLLVESSYFSQTDIDIRRVVWQSHSGIPPPDRAIQ